ncbi:MAG TPA: 23S rRNA (adenine(2503)-C(2))-methyltransferase RlmN [Clostridiales bacterium]|nr:23S rRNA (adenine(2503)-C(2))-methyltransferase RlmN [Clostridiales bacterium]
MEITRYSEKVDIKSLNYEELKESLKSFELQSYRAEQIYNWLHVKTVCSFEEMTNLSEKLRKELNENYYINILDLVKVYESKIDGTKKFLFKLKDDKIIESVLMKYHHGNSVCISSQVGCKMGCKFCASTIGGLERNLTASEMLEQIYRIQDISNERVDNVVIMGTGEPFDNYQELMKFLRMITCDKGFNISSRNITVSTCGIPEYIKMFANEGLPVNLAISLHGPNDDVRQELMPVAQKYSVNEILDSCLFYYNKTKRRITFEYSMVSGINDDFKHAKELSKILKGLNCHVNLINVNPIKERNFQKAEEGNIQEFKKILEKNRINVTIRREMGSDINAACGQLRKDFLKIE